MHYPEPSRCSSYPKRMKVLRLLQAWTRVTSSDVEQTFFLMATRVQSKVENSPPQTAKLPPILGASLLMACGKGSVSPENRRSFWS